MAVGNLPGGAGHLRDGAGDAADEGQPEEAAERDEPGAGEHPRTVVEEEAAGAEGRGAGEQSAAGVVAVDAGAQGNQEADPVGARGFGLHEEAAVDGGAAGGVGLGSGFRVAAGGRRVRWRDGRPAAFHGRAAVEAAVGLAVGVVGRRAFLAAGRPAAFAGRGEAPAFATEFTARVEAGVLTEIAARRAAPALAKADSAWRARELEAQGLGNVHGLAGEDFQVVREQQELHAVSGAVAGEGVVPLGARLALQLAHDGAGGGLDAGADVAGQEGVKAAAGGVAQAEPDEEHQHEQVQREPGENLGGEGEAWGHGISGRRSM